MPGESASKQSEGSAAPQYSLERNVESAIACLARAKRIVVFSGAGMSAESGINTFRDPEVGVWRNKIALALFAIPFGWRWMPSIAWWGYKKFHHPIAVAQPNAGHVAVAQMQAELQLPSIDAVQVITQNVDALHQRAGSSEELVYEVHGSVWRHRCIKHGHPMPHVLVDGKLPASQPHCTVCDSPARPDAVLFSESLPEEAWSKAVDAVRALRAGDVLFVIGTSGVVQPAASLPGMCRAGVTTIEVNREATEHTSQMDICILSPSAEVLPMLLQRAKAAKATMASQRLS